MKKTFQSFAVFLRMKAPTDSCEIVMVHEQGEKWIANVRFTNYVLEQRKRFGSSTAGNDFFEFHDA